MRILLVSLLLISAALHAQEYGDAPASYGTHFAWGAGQTCWLGSTVTSDTTNPVSPAWTGDVDDGLVGPHNWSSWSSDNSLTVYIDSPINTWGPEQTHVPAMVYLVAFVDANDDGMFSANETYLYSPFRIPTNQQYTIRNIRIHATQNFSRNGLNKVGVRIAVQDTIGGPPVTHPNGSFFMGEVEDWLIDVSPAALVVATETLPAAHETLSYGTAITAANGAPPYQWSLQAGTLPLGLSLAQVGDEFVITGTPATGTGLALYPLTVQVTDAALDVSTRVLNLRVDPAPYALPFQDNFSVETGWSYDHLWARAAVSGAAGGAVHANFHGHFPYEPAQDFTVSSTDNMALMDSPGVAYQQGLHFETWATSPLLDCSSETSVQLRFRRWLSHANGHSGIRIQARGNGGWVTVWDRLGPGNFAYPTTVDIAWTLELVDISAVVAGCSQAQVRFGIGPEMFGEQDWYGYMGWCIDDLEVVRTPHAAPSAAAPAVIASPNSFVGTGWPAPVPVIYPGHAHGFSIDISNIGGPALTISSVEAAIVNDIYVQSQWTLPIHYEANSSWYGSVLAAVSGTMNIAANSASATVNGILEVSGLPLNAAYTQMTAHFFLRGIVTATGQKVELLSTTRITPSPTPLPGLRVHEDSVSSGPAIANGAGPSGLRAFGSVAAGSNSNWVYILLRNSSSTPLTVAAPTLVGQDPTQFQLFTASMVFTLTSGQSTWFTVRFSPTGTGARSAIVMFTHDAANTGTPFEFGVSGLGIGNGPVLAVHENNLAGSMIANGSAAANARDFGQVLAGAQASLTVHVENMGNQDLVLGSPTLSGPGAASFSLSGTLPPTLAPGAWSSFQVLFAPPVTGVFHATINFTHNDAGQSTPFTFGVTGTGIGNSPLVRVDEGFIGGTTVHYGATASGGRLFGPRDVGTGPSAETVILIGNTGWQPLTLGSPAMVGAHIASFAIDDGRMALVLQPGEWTGFTVAFDPLAKGLKVAHVEFAHDDPTVTQPFRFEVRGLGIDANGVRIDSTMLPLGKAGDEYGPFQVLASLGTQPYTWEVIEGQLPVGMSFTTDGVLSGTPLTHGIFGLRLRVADALGGDDVRYFELLIQPPPGYIEKGGSKADSGCAATGAGCAPILLALLAIRRRRRLGVSRERR